MSVPRGALEPPFGYEVIVLVPAVFVETIWRRVVQQQALAIDHVAGRR